MPDLALLSSAYDAINLLNPVMATVVPNIYGTNIGTCIEYSILVMLNRENIEYCRYQTNMSAVSL